MKVNINYQQLGLMIAVSAIVVYASNRRVPVFGNGVRRAIG